MVEYLHDKAMKAIFMRVGNIGPAISYHLMTSAIFKSVTVSGLEVLSTLMETVKNAKEMFETKLFGCGSLSYGEIRIDDGRVGLIELSTWVLAERPTLSEIAVTGIKVEIL